MPTNHKNTLMLLAVLSCAVGATTWLTTSAASARNALARAAQPTPIAVMNVNRVLERLNEKIDRERELKAYFDTLENRVNELGRQAEQKKAELDVLPRDDAAFKATREELVRLTIQRRTEEELSQALAEERRKQMQLELFQKIANATEAYARREGYKIVISDDSDAEIPPTANAQQVTAAILSRKLLFADSSIDISEAVASVMNNEYRAR